MTFLVVLALIGCFMAAMIVGCKDNTAPNTTTGATQGISTSDPTATTGADIATTPTDATDDGSIEIILPNENDGEEGEDEYGPMANGGQSDPFTGNTGSDNTGAGTDATSPGDSNSDVTEPTQGNTGNGTAGGDSGNTDDDGETPDLVIDFEDIYGS